MALCALASVVTWAAVFLLPVLVALAITGALGALILPAVRNTAMEPS
jgi:hypothetical protein